MALLPSVNGITILSILSDWLSWIFLITGKIFDLILEIFIVYFSLAFLYKSSVKVLVSFSENSFSLNGD